MHVESLCRNGCEVNVFLGEHDFYVEVEDQEGAVVETWGPYPNMNEAMADAATHPIKRKTVK